MSRQSAVADLLLLICDTNIGSSKANQFGGDARRPDTRTPL